MGYTCLAFMPKKECKEQLIMSADYKQNAERQKKSGGSGSFASGLLLGFLLGVATSLAMVMFIKGNDSPFTPPPNTSPTTAPAEKAPAKTKPVVKPTPIKTPNTDAVTVPEQEKSFDFYNILPGTSPATETAEEKNTPAPPPVAQETYFLQVGAFQMEEDANNMKVKLALQGFEALVQTASIPNKGLWHRVQVGPLSNLSQINKVKSDLAKNGFSAELIKVRNENP